MAKAVRSVERVIEILHYLNRHNGSNSNQVAIGTDLARGTAYRMLETLRQMGMVETHGDAAGYWLTQKILSLSSGFDNEARIVNIASSEIVALNKSIVWPAMLAVPRGIDMEVRFTTDASTPLVFRRFAIGHTVPMLGSASGRCFLAFASQSIVETTLKLLATNSPEPWRTLAANRQRLKRLLRDIRVKGYAMENSPEGGTISVAMPLLQDGLPCAVLVTRYFKRSLSIADAVDRLVGPMKATASRISDRLTSQTNGPHVGDST